MKSKFDILKPMMKKVFIILVSSMMLTLQSCVTTEVKPTTNTNTTESNLTKEEILEQNDNYIPWWLK